MALLLFRSEIDSIRLIDAHELQRRRDEPTVMEETHSDRARNVAVRVEIEPPRQPDDRPDSYWAVAARRLAGANVGSLSPMTEMGQSRRVGDVRATSALPPI